MSFLGFPRLSGYSIQVRLADVQGIDVKFSQNFTHQKSLKSVNFWESYFKNKKVDVFLDTAVERPLYPTGWAVLARIPVADTLLFCTQCTFTPGSASPPLA